MSILRCLAVVGLLALASEASAQAPVFKPDLNPPAGTAFLAENAQTIGIVWGIVAGAAVLAIIGGIVLTLWARTKQTNDPLRLAMADPWMRARLEAMSEHERAQFLTTIRR
jgi:hypothetical protein